MDQGRGVDRWADPGLVLSEAEVASLDGGLVEAARRAWWAEQVLLTWRVLTIPQRVDVGKRRMDRRMARAALATSLSRYWTWGGDQWRGESTATLVLRRWPGDKAVAKDASLLVWGEWAERGCAETVRDLRRIATGLKFVPRKEGKRRGLIKRTIYRMENDLVQLDKFKTRYGVGVDWSAEKEGENG